jgi:pimeloyl-ACP methyl ester carboxylesterase
VTGGGPARGNAFGRTSAGPHRIAYLEWGRPDADRTVVCVHGLTGCARDFDVLAPALADAGYRVVCPDVVGRGDSDRLADPAGYELRQYVSDMRALLEHLEVRAVDWIGTSMGGLIGMAMAVAPDTAVHSLVVNDIGPFVPVAALRRLDAYVGHDPHFDDLAAVEAHLRLTRAPFGSLTDLQWQAMAERTTRPDGAGYRLHYDSRISVNLHASSDKDLDVWRLWDAITCPVLVLRGAESDLLLAETAREMSVRGPAAEVIEFSGCGHNPPLLDQDQVGRVVDWLCAVRSR